MVLLVAGLIGGCQAGERTSYPIPPVDTFTAATFQVTIQGETTTATGAAVGTGFFDAARVRPLLGRTFSDADYVLGGTRVAIVSHAFWTTHLASSPEVIGRTVDVDGRPTVIVGITPAGFDVPTGAAIWGPRQP
jgi:hypothetical protein